MPNRAEWNVKNWIHIHEMSGVAPLFSILFLIGGCATGPLAPLVPAENAPYLRIGSGQIKGLVLVNGAPAFMSTVYLCPNTPHFSDWAARANPLLWVHGTLPPLGAEDSRYVRKAQTDVAGRFSFRGIPSGSYIVLKAFRGVKRVVRLEEGETIEVKLEDSILETDPNRIPNLIDPPPRPTHSDYSR